MDDTIELNRRPVLTTMAQLLTELAKAKPGGAIQLSAGIYTIRQPLVVPAGVSLDGVGEMVLDVEGRPKGFGLTTTLRAHPTLLGDIVRLADGARVRGVRIEDVAGRKGNLLVVSSMKPDDRVFATIEECELYNPNKPAQGLDGPIGRGVLAVTRNPFNAAPPAPVHAGASVSVAMRRSIIRAPEQGTGVFAVNFAPRARVIVRLERNVIGGGLDAIGGVSRPSAVTASETIIFSDHNVYRADSVPAGGIGWSLHGGVSAPIPGLATQSANANLLIMNSTGDWISNFNLGLSAAGAWRPFSASGSVNQNRLHVSLNDVSFKCQTADVSLFAAKADVPDGAGFRPGDDNRLYVTLQGVTASGTRSGNSYADSASYDGQALIGAAAGVGNRLEILGKIPFVPGPALIIKP